MSPRILKPHPAAIPVLLDIEQQLQRELLARTIEQQTDLELIGFHPPVEPRGAEFAVSTKLLEELNERDDCELVVVITSVERYGEDAYRDVCSRWLDEFPELLVIAVSWNAGVIFTLRQEIREDEIHQLDEMLATIRALTS